MVKKCSDQCNTLKMKPLEESQETFAANVVGFFGNMPKTLVSIVELELENKKVKELLACSSFLVY